ncbi:SUMF1/EgtB/PvdO family nonheme iron enzyme [Scytonema sp. NUACC21]
MSVQLSHPDFQRLTQIVQKLPDFSNVRDRRRLIAGALEGLTEADAILAQLDLDGKPQAVSVEVVSFLYKFRQVANGQEVLWIFLNYIQSLTGDEDTAFIQNLFQKYSTGKPASSNPQIDCDPLGILDRIVAGNYTESDLKQLRRLLSPSGNHNVVQLGKYNVNIGQGQGDIHIGDRIYQGPDAETILNKLQQIINFLEKTYPENVKGGSSASFSPNAINENSGITSFLKTQEPVPPPVIKPFQFEVVTVDLQGKIIQRSNKQADYFEENLGDGIVLEMVSIPGGKFQIGAPQNEHGTVEDERPQCIVNVTPFFMGKYPITQMQWRAVSNLPRIQHHLDEEPSSFQGNKLPIESISFFEAREFCARLSQKTGRKYRLPSEAEWEYAGEDKHQAVSYPMVGEDKHQAVSYPMVGEDKHQAVSYPMVGEDKHQAVSYPMAGEDKHQAVSYPMVGEDKHQVVDFLEMMD